MARSLWSGSISFGLVSIPVRMFTAERDHEVHFHQLNERTGHRIRYEKVDATTGREVTSDHIVRGFEVSKGKWVTLDDDEFDKIRPQSTRTVDIEDFVDLAEIDPIFFDRTYYLAPDDNTGAKRAYALLLSAMQHAARAGLGKVVIRNKQYLAAIRPYGDILALSTMRFADEVVPTDAITDLEVTLPKADAKARKMAESLIDSLTGPFDPSKYHDTYTEELHAVIARKAKGETIEATTPEKEMAAPNVVDLTAVLQASVDAAKKRRNGASAPAKKSASRKSAPKKAAHATTKRTHARKAG